MLTFDCPASWIFQNGKKLTQGQPSAFDLSHRRKPSHKPMPKVISNLSSEEAEGLT
jgi:hypothetical protein